MQTTHPFSGKKGAIIVVVLLGILTVLVLSQNPSKSKQISTVVPPNADVALQPEVAPKPSLVACLSPERCVISGGDAFSQTLGILLGETTFRLNGKIIRPKNIIYTISYTIYTDEPIADGEGTVLLSSQKVYDEEMGELTITIGVNESYFMELTPSQRESLYTAQLVRTVFALQQKKTNDYVQIYGLVDQMAGWKPVIINSKI